MTCTSCSRKVPEGSRFCPHCAAPAEAASLDYTLVPYELFAGQQAFKASTAAELARLQAESTPTSPTRLVADLDPSVERAILRCLEKEPRDRPASAIAVAASSPGGGIPVRVIQRGKFLGSISRLAPCS